MGQGGDCGDKNKVTNLQRQEYGADIQHQKRHYRNQTGDNETAGVPSLKPTVQPLAVRIIESRNTTTTQ